MRSSLLVFLLAAACNGGVPGRTDPMAVHVEGRAFRDGLGRQLLFRGYNAKAHGLFDVSFSDGRTPNYDFIDFGEPDAQRFEELGFDVIRLPVSWSALEPQPRQYAAAFLSRLGEVLALARLHHFWVLFDMHQDAYSKEIGEDGAPLWAIVPPPTMLLEGPSSDDRRLTNQVLDAGFSFWNNAPATDGRPLQDAFIAAVQQVARSHGSDPALLGYDAFNEPVLFDVDLLDQFHARFAAGIHAIDRDAPILFEPLGDRNQADHARIAEAPWSDGPGAYAPHIYTGQFSMPSQNGWESEDPTVLAPSMAAADVEAAAWGTPLFVGEFGCDQSIARGPKWFDAELDLQDAHLASSTAWARECGSWGLCDDAGVERATTARVMSRLYPRAVAGDLIAIEHPEPGHLLVRYRASARTHGLAHEVSASTANVLDDYVVKCDGVEVAAERATGRVSFVCPVADGEQTFELVGTPAM